MTYFITPVLGLTLPTPATAQTFETPVVNNNFILLENGIQADRVRITATEVRYGFVADLDALLAVSSPVSGWIRIVAEGGASFEYNGSIWTQKTLAVFATTTLRDSAYAKASAGYRVGSAQVRITPTGYLTQWSTVSSTWKPLEAGLVRIPLGSIAGVGAALSADGFTVNLTAFTTTGINLPTVFTTDFDKYRIEIDVQASTTLSLIIAQMSAAAVVDTAANYDVQILSSSAAAAGAGTTLAATSWALSNGAGAIQKITIELNDPALAKETAGIVTSLNTNNPMVAGTTGLAFKAMLHRLATAYSGLQIATSGGTVTAGTIRVYGYSN